MHGVPPARFVAAVFVYVLPCAALLLTERFGSGLLAGAIAVPSCLLGRMLEQHATKRRWQASCWRLGEAGVDRWQRHSLRVQAVPLR